MECCWFILWKEFGLFVYIFCFLGIYVVGCSVIDFINLGKVMLIDKLGYFIFWVYVDDIV